VTRALVPLYTPDAQERRQREQIADALPRPGLLDPTIRTQDFTAVPGGTYRIAGAAVRVMLPQPAPELFGKTVTLFLESGAASVWQAGVASQLSGLSSVGRYVFSCSLGGWRIDELVDGAVATSELADNAVTDAKLRDSAAYSLLGRPTSTSGDPGDISLASLSNTFSGRVNGGNVAALSRSDIAQVAFPRPRWRYIEEDFVGGLTTDGNIGRTNMRLYGTGSPSLSKGGNVNFTQLTRVTLSTSAVSGDSAALGWHSVGTAGFLSRAQVYLWQSVVFLGADATTFETYSGLTDDAAGGTSATDFCGLIRTNTNNNWRIFVRQGGVTLEDTDTGIAGAVSSAFNLVLVNNPSDTFTFYINGALAGTTTNVPGNNLHPVVGTRTTGAAVRSINPHYLLLVYRQLTQAALDDDDPIDALVTRG
jgi:hypothetical protein